MGLYKAENLLHGKKHNQQREATVYRMEENLHQLFIQKGINIQNT
jgi:hypothetical protein